MELKLIEQNGFKTLKEVYKIVSCNFNRSCVWVPAITSKGSIVDVCGRNHDSSELYKISVPQKIDGKWVVYNNGYTKTNFDIQIERNKEYPDWYTTLILPNYNFQLGDTFKTANEFLDYIDTKEDLNSMTIETEPVYKEVCTGYKVTNF